MRPGRLPEDDPREQQARAKLRALSPAAQAKRQQEQHPSPDVKPNAKPQVVIKRWT
jgi:hypothetical protein